MQGQSTALYHPTADDSTIQALSDAGKSSREIARIVGNIAHGTIAKRLKHLTPRKATEIFKGHRADIFAELGRKLASTLDAKAIKEMHPRDRFLALGLVYDKEQIERGRGGDARPMIVIQIKGDVQSVQCQAVDNPVSGTQNG